MPGKKKYKKTLPLEVYQREYKKIGKQLTLLRKEAGYSSGLDFALDNELPPSQYARFESGSNMQLDSLIYVLSKHKMTLEQFFRRMQ
jgi:hypothetical protein